MRTVLGYIDGKPQWSDNVPAAAISGRVSGSLVVGGPAGMSLYIPTNHEALRSRARHISEKKAAQVARERDARAGAVVAEDPCAINGRCRHSDCARARGTEAKRLYGQGLTLVEVGVRLGGRHETTVRWLLGTRADAA